MLQRHTSNFCRIYRNSQMCFDLILSDVTLKIFWTKNISLLSFSYLLLRRSMRIFTGNISARRLNHNSYILFIYTLLYRDFSILQVALTHFFSILRSIFSHPRIWEKFWIRGMKFPSKLSISFLRIKKDVSSLGSIFQKLKFTL